MQFPEPFCQGAFVFPSHWGPDKLGLAQGNSPQLSDISASVNLTKGHSQKEEEKKRRSKKHILHGRLEKGIFCTFAQHTVVS